MPLEVLTAIIAGASGLVGAVVGAGATLLAGRFQHARQVKNERANVNREQSELAARTCESLFDQLAKDVTLNANLTDLKNPAAQARFERIDSTLPQVNAAALYLSEPLRGRIKAAAEVLYNAENIVLAGTHYHSVGTIAGVVRDEVYAMAAAFIQDKDHPETDSKMAEYWAALKDYYAELYEGYDNPNDDAYRCARESFYTRHSELRPPSSGARSLPN